MAWNDITVSDEYKQLSPRGRARLKQRFFEESILPDLATISPEGQEKAFNRFMETPDDTGEGLVRSALGSAARGFFDPLAAAPEVAGAYLGIEGLEEFGGDVRGAIEGAFPVNPAEQGLVTDVAGVLGQVGQIVATGGGGAVAGAKLLGRGATEAAKRQAMRFGATAAQQTAMGSSAVAGGLERAEQLGLEGGDRLLRGAIAGGTELLAERLGGFATELGGVGKALGFGSDTIESGFMKPILRGMVTEIPEEMGVETAGQLTDIAMAPETAPAFDFGQTAYAGLLGAAGGAAFGGIEAAITPRTKKAFDGTTDFIPSSTPPPGMTVEEAEEQDLLKYGNAGEIIGYVLPVSDETIEGDLPLTVDTNVEPLVENAAAAPEANATASALRRIAAEGAGAPAATQEIPDEIVTDETTALREAGLRMLTGQPTPIPAQAETVTPAPVAEQIITEQEDQAALEQQQQIETPISEQPANVAPRASNSVQPRPERVGRNTDARDAWDEQFGSLRRGGRTHNDDGTPYQPTVFDEVMGQVTEGLKGNSIDENIDAIGVDAGIESGTAVKQLLNDGWVWDEQNKRMVDTKNKGESPAAALRRIRSKKGQQQQPTETNVPLTQETLQQEQSRGQELQEPRELPILPAEQAAQAPEAAVGTEAAVDTQAALDTQGDGIVRDEGIVGADVELEQQKATLPVDVEGAMLQGGDVRQEETQQVSAAADVPTESLPAGQLTPRGVGVARDAELLPMAELTPQEYLSKYETPQRKRAATIALKNVTKLESEFEAAKNNSRQAFLRSATGGGRVQDEIRTAQDVASKNLKDAERKLKKAKSDLGAYEAARKNHIAAIESNLRQNRQVSSLAVDTYGIKLPQGYTRQGDLYVFQPESNATPPPQAQPQPATPATQETKPQAAASTEVTATQESTAAQPAEAVVELTELPSYFQRNPQQKKLWDVDESYAEPARISQSVGDKIGPRGTAFTVEQLMYQIAALREFVSNMNGRLLRGGDKGASTKELAEKWTTLRGFEALAAEYAAKNPQEWQSYRNRQNELLGLEAGADVIVPYPSPDTAPLGNIGKLDKKFSKNWRVIYPNGETALFHPTALRAVSDTAETVESDVIEEVTPLTQAQAAIVDKLPELEARDAQRRGLGFDYPRARIGRLPGDQNAYISRPDQKNVGVLSPDGSIKMLTPEESTSIQGEINAFEKRQAAQIDKRMATLREEAKKQSESKLYQLTPSDPVVRRLDGKWINNNTGKPLGRSKNDQRLLSQLENNPNIESYQVVAQSTDGGVSFIPVSRAAQPAAGETGDAGAAISPTGETVQSSETPSALSKLQSYISTLSPKAQAAWTPERLSAAESYYATSNESALEPLTATQRKIVMREGVSESDAAAYEAKQKRQFALRNPPAATDSQFLEDYNAYVNSLSDETLQKERESREESPDETPRYKKILRSADGSIRRTGVKSTPARAARNSYIGVIPGVENTWLGTVEEFDAEFPDGYEFGGTVARPPDDSEALTAADGRPFIFLDRVTVLDGDAERAEAHGTSPGVEAIKRLLRHESFIHRGYMALPGPLKNRFSDFVASGIIPPEDLDYLVNNGYPHYKGWRDSKSTEMLAAEEWLAQRVERMGRIPQSGPIASIMDWLRDVWRWLTGRETTDLDKLRNTMRAMHKALGALDPRQRIVMELPDMGVLRQSVAQTQQDQEYLAAVERGDMETAQRMVDEAARAAGFNITSWHGSNQPSANFSYYLAGRGGYRFFSNKEYAETYAGKDGTMRRSFLMTLKPFNIRNESGSKDYTAKEAADLLTSRGLDVSGIEFKEKSPLWSQMQSQGVKQSLEKAGFDSVVISETDDGDMTRMVFNPNQIKSADPVTYDSNGAPIPLSQRFQSTSSDIRYSKVQRPDPILNQPSRLRGNVPETTKPNAQRRSVSEIFEGLDGAVEVIPRQYFPMGSKEKGNEFSATDALLSWSKDLLKPYAEDIGGLIEFLAILRSDERLQNELKLGPRSGAVVMPFLAQEAANRANTLGSTDMRNAFLMEYDALGTAGGQNLWAFNIISRLPEFSSNTYSSTLDKTEEQNFAATVDKKTNGEKTVKDVISNLPEAGEVAADNVSDGLAEEKQISDKVLELGASVQGNPKLSERIRQVISDVLKRGFLLRAMEKLKGEARKSIIPDSNIYDGLTLEEMEAELARLDKGIADSIDFIENEVAKDTAKEKTPSDSAQRIINRIINKAKRKERKEGKPDPVEELYKADLKSPMNEADFIEKAVELGVEENVALELKNAIDLQLTAKALESALGTLGSDIESNIKKANEQANKFQKRADALIDNIVNRMADPPLARDRKAKAVDPLQKAYRDQLKKPVSREEFIENLEKINVFDQTASLLFDAAEMERASREAIAAARKLPKLPIETAKEIINKITTAAAKVPAKKKQPDAVRSLYRKHLKKPMSEAEFSAEAKAVGLDAATTKGLYDAINLEIVAIEIQAQAKAAERAQTKELKKAEREAEKYQNQAEAKINEIADALADPSLTQDKEKVVNPLTEIYQNQIKTPITEPQFVEQVVALGVDEETATLLFSIAAMDRQARIDIRVAREDLRRREMSEAQASKLIYAQEEELRQGSKDREPSKSGDSINKAFREQVVNPLSQEKFRERLDKLKVSQKLADRIYATAERVATDNERAEVYRKRVALLDVDSAALTRFVNDLRLKGKLTGEPIQWRDLLSLPVAHQDTVKAELLARVKRHEALRNLSTGEQQAIADALNTIWQRERRKVFQAMIKKADLMGVSKEDQEIIVEAMPALLKYINQGMLGTSAFYRAVGEKFGIAPISVEARKQVEEMAAKMQEKELYSFERAVLAEKILKILQNNTQLSRAEILSSWWVNSVLTGGRTIFDMALGVLNGGFSIAKKMITATIETRSPRAAIDGLSAFGDGLWAGAQVALKNLFRPEEGLLASRNPAVADYFDKGAIGAGLTTGDKLLIQKGDKPKDKLKRGLGVWMSFFERLFAGLDHITSTATMHGTIRMAAAMNPKMFSDALIPTKQDYANAMERAKLRLPGGSKAAQIRLSQSIIEDGQHILERGLDESFMSQWRQLVADSRAEGNTASYQEEPTGAGGLIYGLVRKATSGLEDKTKGYRDEARISLTEARKTGRGVASSAVNYFVASLGYFLGTLAQNLLGVRFMRFTGNKLNELISFIPIVGMARLQEKGMVSGENYTLRGQNVRANQVLGWMSAVIYLMLLNDLDEEDEERGWIVNGSWDNLTPERKSQQMAVGLKPNTYSKFNKETGRWTSYNFVSWPFAGWMAAFGSVSDYKRLTPEKWNEKVLADKMMAAAYAGAFALKDISSLSSLTEMFGTSSDTTDPAEAAQKRFVKGASNFAGGFIPKTFKDVDAWFDETNYKPQDTFEHFAKEVPFYRRSIGEPLRDIFYEKVQVSRTPWSRAIQISPDDPAYRILGRLNSNGIWITPANPSNRKVKRGGKLRDMTDEEANAYMAEVGKRYKEFVMKQGDRLLEMDVDRADELVSKYTARIREIAFKRAIATAGKAAIPSPE